MRKSGKGLTPAERDAAIERGSEYLRMLTVETEHGEAAHTAQFSLRLSPHMKAALEAAAKRRGHSINTEINRRLQKTFGDESAVGGGAMYDLTRLWAAAFVRGGNLAARALGHPEWEPDEWLSDFFAYKTAVVAGQDALDAAQPLQEGCPPGQAEKFREYLALQRHFTARVARGAPLQLDRSVLK
jgi:hypothetical protein